MFLNSKHSRQSCGPRQPGVEKRCCMIASLRGMSLCLMLHNLRIGPRRLASTVVSCVPTLKVVGYILGCNGAATRAEFLGWNVGAAVVNSVHMVLEGPFILRAEVGVKTRAPSKGTLIPGDVVRITASCGCDKWVGDAQNHTTACSPPLALLLRC